MSDCVFCKIVKGEIPSFKVREDDSTLAFLDIHPVNPGHTIVIAKRHSRNIFDVLPEDWDAVTKSVRKLSGVIEKALDADGININMNNREHAGQVVDHLHVHIIPRFKGDGFKLWHQSSYKDGEAVLVQEKILAQLS
ncbi:hypothetical protein A3C86_04990 [Candidatus Kaiserbacteria bacterium RIFCSPHIGHO2_02_FULL_49_16]|uniref:HIT domain-containing protein n=1 Tax=Candidatus Kaiserbacteria bacterium RIFCSPHIGHO2_02_FULL_49_16 TaxID=1798490 RepID=A0A1F6DG12_9BACT|nr:MAG: hypothetical protein A3C86_04990 [Candidatus Kaiserbacteria bacterium RIFCSPHIGHO2_02_FULL_49_16]